MIKVTGQVEGDASTVASIRMTALRIDAAVVKFITAFSLRFTARVKQKLSGEVLNVRTGRLRRSIHPEYKQTPNSFHATVGTNVEYAKTHELGLTIPPRIIEARRGKALRFEVGGKVVFARRVSIPAVKMPRRSFLQASLMEMTPEFREGLGRAIGTELNR